MKISNFNQEQGSLQQLDNRSNLKRLKRSDDNLKLPDNFEIGQAIGGGDCFFDSVAKGLKQIKSNKEFTVKLLRELCHKYALENEWVKTAVVNDARLKSQIPNTVKDNDIWNAYLLGIRYTAGDIEKMESSSEQVDKDLYRTLTSSNYGETLVAPIWGRSEIEGRMVCEGYSVKLHVVEKHNVDEKELWTDQIVDKLGSKSVSAEDVNYSENDVIHIVNKGNLHFEPVLSTQKIKYREHRSSDSSDYDDNQVNFDEELMRVVRSDDLQEEEKIEKIKDLLKNGANVNFKDANHQHNTPLHAAVRKGESKVVELLVERGASVKSENTKSETPLDIAKRSKRPNRRDIVQILETKVRALEEASSQHTIEEEPAQQKRTRADSEENKQEGGNLKKPRLESPKPGPSSQVGQASGIKRKNFEKMDEQDGSPKKTKVLNEYEESSRKRKSSLATDDDVPKSIFPPFSGKLKVDKNLKLSNIDIKTLIQKIEGDKGSDLSEILKDYKDFESVISSSIKDPAIDKINMLDKPVYPPDSLLVQLASRVYKEEGADSFLRATLKAVKEVPAKLLAKAMGTVKVDEKLPELPKGWQLLTTAYNNELKLNGYFGAAYWNPDHQQIVVAHMGTDPFNPGAFWADIKGVFLKRYVAQMSSANTFANKIIIVLNALNEEPGVNFKLSFTGHSLGGWLAQITTFTTKYLVRKGENFEQNQDLHGGGYHAHTVVFDSPGCRQMLSDMEERFGVRYGPSSLSTAFLDITTYLSSPNLVNTCNSHYKIGKIYRVFIDLPEEYTMNYHKYNPVRLKSWFETNIVKYTLVTHDIEKIKKVFDPKTEQVRRIEEVIDWPVNEGMFDEYGNFHSLAKGFSNYHPEQKNEDFLLKILEKSGYYPIRYQTQPVDEKACSVNIFTQSEFKFLDGYQKLRELSEASFTVFEPKNFLSSLRGEEAIERIIRVLGTFKIENGYTINCGQLELQEFITHVKNMLHFFPGIKSNVENALKPLDMQKGTYKLESDRYVNSIDKKGINFREDALAKDVKNLSIFLKHTNRQVLQWIFQTDTDTSIGVNKVYKIFENIQENKHQNTFLNLEGLLNLELHVTLIKFLEQINDHLFVIECKHSYKLNKGVETFFENLFDTLKKSKSNIKLILITQESNELSDYLKKKGEEKLGDEYKIKDDPGIKFSDLNKASQNLLLEKEVIFFQGKKTSLDKLIDKEDEESKKIIDLEVLLKLIKGEKIEIGIKRPDLSDLESIYYVTHAPMEKEQFLRAVKSNLSNLFVISGTTEDEFSKLIPEKKAIRVLEKDDKNEEEDKFIILIGEDNEKNLEDFKRVCSDYHEKTSHLIEKKGNELTWKRSYDPSFYIPRKLYHVVIKEGSLKKHVEEERKEKKEDSLKKHVEEEREEEKKDIFAVSDIENEEKFKELYKVSEINNLLSISNPDKNHIIILNGKNKEKSFESLCNNDKLKDYNIHWLQNKNDKLIWRRSKGKIDKIHDLKDTSSKFPIDKDDLNKITGTEKAVVIADESGMGKSTTLTHLLRQPEKFEWIIKLNLINLQEQLEKLNNINDLGSIIENLFSKIDIGVKEKLAERLLKHRIEHQGKITLLFDGFDEITDKNQEKVIELLKFLKNTQVKVQVATRLHVRDKLEKALSVFSYTFQPFSKEDQLDFLERFWKSSFKLTIGDKIIDKTLKKNVNRLFKPFYENIQDKKYEFMSIPLLTRMFAEVCQEIVESSCNPDNQAKLQLSEEVKKLSILNLYEKFIERKYEIYFKEKTKIKDAPSYIKNQLTKALNKDHQRLALHNLFSGLKETKILADERKLLSEGENKDLKLVGIIQSIGNKGNSYFIHKTFAEYFAAGLLADIAERKESNPTKHNLVSNFLREHIFKEKNKVIRNFFDRMLAKDKENENKYEIHRAVLNNDKEEVGRLLTEGENIINIHDKAGRTPLHLAAAYGDKVLLNKLKKTFDVRDELFGWYALIHAERSYNMDTAIPLLEDCVYKFEEKFISENSGIRDKDILNTLNSNKETLLHRAVKKGYMKLTEFLVGEGADINAVDNDGWTPLLWAARNRVSDQKWDMVEFLVDRGADVNIANQDGWTPLLWAARNRVSDQKWDMVEFLVDRGADVNIANQDGWTPLLWAAKNRVSDQKWDMVEFLVDRGADVNIANQDGWTPLLWAAKNLVSDQKWDMVEFLVDRGADVNIANQDGWTPAYWAARNEVWDMVKYFLKKGANVNAVVRTYGTLLDMVTDDPTKEILESTQGLFTVIKNVNLDENQKITELENLINGGAIIHATDSYDYLTPLHYAAKSGYPEVVRTLLNKNTYVNAMDKNGKTPLDLAKEQLSSSTESRPEVIQAYQDIINALVDLTNQELWKDYIRERQEVEALECLSGRRKRETKAGECELSWDDMDKFSEEKEGIRDFSKIKINSDKFINYIKSESISGNKLEQLVQLAGKVQVTGKFQGLVSKLISNQKVMNHLNRVGRVSGIAMHGMMGKNVVADFLNGDYTGVAVNVGFIAGGQGFAKVAEAASLKGTGLVLDGKLFLGRSLKAASPFLARGTSAFVVYDLVSQIKEFKNGTEEALVSVIGDSIYLGVDAAEIGIEIAEAFDMFEGVSAITGPIGAAIGAVIFVGTDIYLAVKRVDKINEIIHLKGNEKFIEGLRAFIGMQPEQYIEELMEEKQVNNQLVKQGLEYLKQHSDIKRYVFPTGKSVIDSCRDVPYKTSVCVSGGFGGGCSKTRTVTRYVEECTTKIQVDLDSKVLLDEKRTDIKWSRIRPDNPSEGELFCLPQGDYEQVPSGGAYLCDNAIGITDSANKTGNYTLINLGKGNDHVEGFPSSNNIFVVDDGLKRYYGGKKDDTFIIQGNIIKGDINGREGVNSIDLEQFVPEQKRVQISTKYITHGNNTFGITNIHKISARKEKEDIISCACDTKHVDSRGGKGNATDTVIIPSSDCSYELQVVARPSTVIYNHAQKGNFTYIVPQEKGEALINLKNNGSKHNFLFDYAVSDLEGIDAKNIDIKNVDNKVTFSFLSSSSVKEDNLLVEHARNINIIRDTLHNGTVVGEVVFNIGSSDVENLTDEHITKSVNVTSVVSALSPYYKEMNSDNFNVTISSKHAMLNAIRTMIASGAFGKEVREKFNVTIEGVVGNSSYILNDGTEIKIGNKGNLYAMQNSNRSIDEIVSNYPAIANRLRMSLFVQLLLSNETIAIGHGNHDVLHNNPYYKSHLIGNGGENIFVVTSGHDRLDESKLPIPEVIIYDVDKENLIDTLDLRQIKQQIVRDLSKEVKARTGIRGQDLLIELFYPNSTQSLVTVRLKDALETNWHERLHVILNDSPMKIEEFELKPLPLIFDESDKNIIVIGPQDIEEENRIVVSKAIGNYIFARLGNDLIITNASDRNSTDKELCTIFLSEFYQEPKMQTLSIVFTDQKISLRDEINKINNAVTFADQLNKFKNVSSIIDNYSNHIIYKDSQSKNGNVTTNNHRQERSINLEGQEFFNAQNNANSSLKGQQVTSGGNKLSSWINTAFGFATKGISQLGSFIFSSARTSLPSNTKDFISSWKEDFKNTHKAKNPESQYIAQFGSEVCVQNNVSLAFLLLQGFLDKKCSLPEVCSISPLEAQANALNITEEFGKILSTTCNAEETIDLAEVQSNIFKAMMSGSSNKIPGILCSHVEEAKLEPEVTKKILAAFQPTKPPIASPSEGKTKHLPSLNTACNNQPKTCLSEVAVDNPSISHVKGIW